MRRVQGNLIAEYDVPFEEDPELATQFTWGLDLSGQNGNNLGGTGVPPVGLHGAGGIGGLLAMVDVPNERQMAYFYNANGDVGQLVDSDTGAGTFGNTLAKHEYYPYGGIFFSLGGFGYVPPNPFKFSTKYRDDETALYYYGYRYHMPRLGRWTNRDPIEEGGGYALYAFVGNNSSNYVDLLGLTWQAPPGSPPGWWNSASISPSEWADFRLLVDSMKLKCDRCCCGPGRKACRDQASEIARAVGKAWIMNKNRTGLSGGHLCNGYFCWDGEKTFYDAATSVSGNHWCIEHGKLEDNSGANDQGRTLVHYYVQLSACCNWKKSCRIQLDDGFMPGNKMIHFGAWPNTRPGWHVVPWAAVDPPIPGNPECGHYLWPPIDGTP